MWGHFLTIYVKFSKLYLFLMLNPLFLFLQSWMMSFLDADTSNVLKTKLVSEKSSWKPWNLFFLSNPCRKPRPQSRRVVRPWTEGRRNERNLSSAQQWQLRGSESFVLRRENFFSVLKFLSKLWNYLFFFHVRSPTRVIACLFSIPCEPNDV